MLQKNMVQKKLNPSLKNTIEAGRQDHFDIGLGSGRYETKPTPEQSKKNLPQRKEFSLFSYNEYYERELLKKQVKELTEQIKKEIELIKKADSTLLSEIKDIENLTLEATPNKPGIYHVRFLEIIMSILRVLRAKVNESRTWLSAMVSRRKKRGSLFMSLSKKKGTQYSLSQELQTSRVVQ